jgi:excinuclease ABC subunit A
MPLDQIVIKGARQHNLKDIDVVIPRDRLVVITGLSGSGKSSLAFDTIYAEGQRRYVESLSSYARQFLGQMDKPDVDYISGLSPAISIDQKGASHNPRSTVGTVTEIYDYLRLLYARIGRPHCPKCGRPIQQQTSEQIVDAVLAMPPRTRIMILAPLVKGRKGEYSSVFEDVRKAGFVRVRVNGEVRDVNDEIKLDRYKMHTIEVVVDRLAVPEPQGLDEGPSPDTGRIADSVEQALKLGEGTVLIAVVDREGAVSEEQLFSEKNTCVYDNISLGEIEPRTFSFNSPHGACPECTGLGHRLEIDPELVIPNKNLSLADGAIASWGKAGINGNAWYREMLDAVSKYAGFSMRAPVSELSDEHLDIVLHGVKNERIPIRHQSKRSSRIHEYKITYEGVISNLERRYKETESDFIRADIERYMAKRPCPTCKGARLKPEALCVTVAGRSISETTGYSIVNALAFFEALEDRRSYDDPRGFKAPRQPWRDERGLTLTDREYTIARQILKEIRARLGFLVDVGLDYLTLDRAGRHTLRRRGPAHPVGDPDRLRANGRPVHPRRAEHRAPPARQRPLDQDAGAAARRRQHADRGRARRGHDPRRRPHHRHRPRRRRPWRRGRRGRHARRRHPGVGLADRPVHERRPRGAGPDHPPTRQRQGDPDPRRPREQPQGRGRDDPARDVRDGDGRVRLRQEHAGDRGAVQGARPTSPPCPRPGRPPRQHRGP